MAGPLEHRHGAAPTDALDLAGPSVERGARAGAGAASAPRWPTSLAGGRIAMRRGAVARPRLRAHLAGAARDPGHPARRPPRRRCWSGRLSKRRSRRAEQVLSAQRHRRRPAAWAAGRPARGGEPAPARAGPAPRGAERPARVRAAPRTVGRREPAGLPLALTRRARARRAGRARRGRRMAAGDLDRAERWGAASGIGVALHAVGAVGTGAGRSSCYARRRACWSDRPRGSSTHAPSSTSARRCGEPTGAPRRAATLSTASISPSGAGQARSRSGHGPSCSPPAAASASRT